MSDILLFLASFILTFLALYLTIHTIVNKKNKRSQEHYTELLVVCKPSKNVRKNCCQNSLPLLLYVIISILKIRAKRLKNCYGY